MSDAIRTPDACTRVKEKRVAKCLLTPSVTIKTKDRTVDEEVICGTAASLLDVHPGFAVSNTAAKNVRRSILCCLR